eukprot:1146478-Pelagomonas_calceolata.AAC.5
MRQRLHHMLKIEQSLEPASHRGGWSLPALSCSACPNPDDAGTRQAVLVAQCLRNPAWCTCRRCMEALITSTHCFEHGCQEHAPSNYGRQARKKLCRRLFTTGETTATHPPSCLSFPRAGMRSNIGGASFFGPPWATCHARKNCKMCPQMLVIISRPPGEAVTPARREGTLGLKGKHSTITIWL